MSSSSQQQSSSETQAKVPSTPAPPEERWTILASTLSITPTTKFLMEYPQRLPSGDDLVRNRATSFISALQALAQCLSDLMRAVQSDGSFRLSPRSSPVRLLSPGANQAAQQAILDIRLAALAVFTACEPILDSCLALIVRLRPGAEVAETPDPAMLRDVFSIVDSIRALSGQLRTPVEALTGTWTKSRDAELKVPPQPRFGLLLRLASLLPGFALRCGVGTRTMIRSQTWDRFAGGHKALDFETQWILESYESFDSFWRLWPVSGRWTESAEDYLIRREWGKVQSSWDVVYSMQECIRAAAEIRSNIKLIQPSLNQQ